MSPPGIKPGGDTLPNPELGHRKAEGRMAVGNRSIRDHSSSRGSLSSASMGFPSDDRDRGRHGSHIILTDIPEVDSLLEQAVARSS